VVERWELSLRLLPAIELLILQSSLYSVAKWLTFQ
jgi:hypothetical protein